MPIDLNVLWAPLVIWSLAGALGAWGIAHYREHLHPHTQHRFAWTLLAALPLMMGGALGFSGLPMGYALSSGLSVIPTGVPIYPGQALVRDLGATMETFGVTWRIAGHAAGWALGLWCGVGLLLTGGRWLRLQRWRRTLRPASPRHMHPEATAWAQAAGVTQPVTYVISDATSTPMTFGWRRPVIVVPSALLDTPDALRAALAHEFAHIRRGDYVQGLVQQALRWAFVWHPVVRCLSDQIDGSREVLCDAEVLRAGTLDPHAYAALVCQAASATPIAMPVVCMARSRTSILLTQRIHAMKHTIQPLPPTTSRRTTCLAWGLTLMLLGATLIVSGPSAQAQTSATVAANAVEGKQPQMKQRQLADAGEKDKLLRLTSEQTLTWERFNFQGDRIGQAQTWTLPAGLYQIQVETPKASKGTTQIHRVSWAEGSVKTYDGLDHPKTARTFKQSSEAVVSLRQVEVKVDPASRDQD